MNKKTQLPSFTRRSSIAIDNDYLDWLSEVKDRLCQIQAKTAFQVNRAMLEFYWSMGRDLALRKELGKHGDGIVTNVSLDLRAAFPTMKGLSENNIWSMKRWFLFYTKGFLHQLGKESKNVVAKLYQPGKVLPSKAQNPICNFLPDDTFFSVPWRHHVEIIQHCK